MIDSLVSLSLHESYLGQDCVLLIDLLPLYVTEGFLGDHNVIGVSSGANSTGCVDDVSYERELWLVIANDSHEAIPCVDSKFEIDLVSQSIFNICHKVHDIES